MGCGRSVWGLAGVGLLVVVGVVGCSSSKPSAGSDQAVSSTVSGTSLSGSPIVIGNIGDYSGAEASGDDPQRVGIEAWASWTNAHGGIDGHPVKLVVMDDQLSATTAVSQVETLIDTDHVSAIVGEVSNFDTDWAPIAARAGVPVVGGLSLDTPFLTSSDFFGTGANAISSNYGILQAAQKNGSKFALLYCTESPNCAQVIPLMKGLASAMSMQIPVVESVSGSMPDFTAQCQAIKSSGAETYYVVEGPSVVTKIVNECAQQGVTAKLIEIDGILTKQFVESLGSSASLDGVDLAFPFFDTSVPASQTFQAAIKQYDPTVAAGTSDVELGPSLTYGWVAGQLFAAAVEASDTFPVTSASVKTGLYDLKGATLGGLTVPLTFTPGQPTLINCYFDVEVTNGAFSEPQGLTPACAPNAVISAIASKL